MQRFTRVVAHYSAGRRFDDICFGDPAVQHEEGNKRIYHFQPGQIFAVIWWRKYDQDDHYGALAVVRALDLDECGHKIPCIQNDVAIHAIVNQYGHRGQDGPVDLLLDEIQELKARGENPAKRPASYWAEITQRILLLPIKSDPATWPSRPNTSA